MEEWDKLYKDACESGVSEDKASMLKSYLCGLIEEERQEFEKGDAEIIIFLLKSNLVFQGFFSFQVDPYVLMSFVYQESSFQSDARPEREKLLGFNETRSNDIINTKFNT